VFAKEGKENEIESSGYGHSLSEGFKSIEAWQFIKKLEVFVSALDFAHWSGSEVLDWEIVLIFFEIVEVVKEGFNIKDFNFITIVISEEISNSINFFIYVLIITMIGWLDWLIKKVAQKLTPINLLSESPNLLSFVVFIFWFSEQVWKVGLHSVSLELWDILFLSLILVNDWSSRRGWSSSWWRSNFLWFCRWLNNFLNDFNFLVFWDINLSHALVSQVVLEIGIFDNLLTSICLMLAGEAQRVEDNLFNL
jgi:hypothetical protein